MAIFTKIKGNQTHGQRGSMVVELVTSLSFLMALQSTILEIGKVIMIQEKLVVASREAALVAAFGGNLHEAEAAARHVLGEDLVSKAQINITELGNQNLSTHNNKIINVRVSVPSKLVSAKYMHWVALSIHDELISGVSRMPIVPID